MRTPTKVITALALAGIAVTGGAAFTGAGLTNMADTQQFIGGTVAQTVVGATLSTVVYHYDPSLAAVPDITTIDLTFTGADESSVVDIVTGGGTANLDLSRGFE